MGRGVEAHNLAEELDSDRALNGKTPYEALYGRPPDLSTLRTWGSRVLVHDPTGSKLSPRAREAR